MAAEQFDGAICEHLVRVHVVRGPCARLERVHDELVAQLPRKHFAGRRLYGTGDLRVERADVCVDARRSFFG
jgi:hypothetical protein